MLFRVTFSNDTEEYYKENPKDIQVSMTLDAKSFKEAELQANHTLTLLVFWPTPFEVVSINRIDESIEEVEENEEIEVVTVEHVHDWKVYNGFYVCANKCGVRLPYDKYFEDGEPSISSQTWKNYDIKEFFEPVSDETANNQETDEPVKKTPEIWCLDTGIQILDPDGWDRKNPESWYTPITRPDFIKRAMMSTCYRWPSPLFDEDREG
jgi:hypothetical protein